MTTYVQARDALVSHLHTHWSVSYPTIKVYYENTLPLALDSVGPVFLKVDVNFDAAVQASVETAPMTRVQGSLLLVVMAAEGAGTRNSLTYVDYLSNLFKYRSLSGVQTGAPTPSSSLVSQGWFYQELFVPFWFDIT
jgi:hypothetical protein